MRNEDFVENLLKYPPVSAHQKTIKYPKNTTIKMGRDKINNIGIVDRGCLKAVNYSKNGEAICSTIFMEKGVVLEYLYLAGSTLCTYNLVSLSDVTICWIPIEIFSTAINENLQLSKLYIDHLIQRGLENQRLITCLSYKTIRERIAYWILSKDNLEVNQEKIPNELYFPISQEIFAEFLHVSRASLSHELHKMQEEGYFKVKRKRFISINKEKMLEEI